MKPVDAEQFKLAMVGAFVWMSSSDGSVDALEYEKFQHVLVESPFVTQIATEDMADIRHTFKDMVALFEQDFDAATQITRKRLNYFVNQPNMSEEIIRLCRAAAVADGQLGEVEELVLKEIAKELRILNV